MSKFIASAPASLMLLGEHAVLHEKLAIVCAINRYVKISLTTRHDRKIYIHSQLGEFESSIDEIDINKNFSFVTAAILAVKTQLPSGFELEINSDFSHQVGLGSSAAISVATVAVLDRWLNHHSTKTESLFLKTRQLVQQVQGLGSGADVAASIWGGCLAYRMQSSSANFFVQQLTQNLPITAVYSGSKKPTREVVQWLEQKRQQNPLTINAIFDKINDSAEQAMSLITAAQWVELGKLINDNQAYMHELGLNNALLDELCFELSQQPNIYGAKISGSGLGDCVIALGKLAEKIFPKSASQNSAGVQQLDITISPQGLHYAEN